MGNLIKMERYKLLHNIVFWIFIIAMPLLGFFSGPTYHGAFVAHEDCSVQIESFSGVFNAMVADSYIILVAVNGLLGWFVGREFSLRTVSAEIASGNSRFDIFASKTIVYLTAYSSAMLLYPLAGAINQIGFFGIGELGDNLLNILRTSVYAYLLLSASFMVTITLAFIVRNGVITAIASPIVCFVMMCVFIMTNEHDLPRIIVFLDPYYRLREITSMGSSLSNGAFLNIPAIITSVVWLAACSIIIWKNFAKSDLK